MAKQDLKKTDRDKNDILGNRIAEAFNKALDKNGKENLPRYQLLYRVLKSLILQNRIPDGMTLPPSRELAERLHISRSTLNKAFDLAGMEGLIKTRQGSGAYVSLNSSYAAASHSSIDATLFPVLSETGKAFSGSASLINSTDDKSIAFRPGIPPLDLFPVNQWKNLSNLYWRHIKSSEMIYSPSAGLANVKKSMANYLNITRAISCDAEHVMIVAGSLQSLYLTGSILINPGDGVLLENPVFPNVQAIFKGLRANSIYGNVDEEGLIIPHHLKPGSIKLIHVTTSCQYPSGVPMSLNRRMELLEFARKHKALIIENDYEHELNNFSTSLPSLYELDGGERVIYLGTFNRLLHPSIRIGYLVVPEYIIRPMESMLKHSHRFVPPSLQVVMSQFIDRKFIYKHVRHVVQVAKERLQLFEKLLMEEMDDVLEIQKTTVPSLHLVVRFKKEMDDIRLAQYLADHHIIVHALSRCYQKENKVSGLIFGYASVRNPVIRNRVPVLTRLIREFH